MAAWAKTFAGYLGLLTQNDRDSEAASYSLFPGWVATRVQSPTASIFALDPETEQILDVLEEKVTGSPELAVAFNLTVAPTV